MRIRIGVLNNLRAARRGRRVERMLAFLRAHPQVRHIETDCVKAVPDALAELARHGTDLLVINGGDGSVHRALTEIFRRPIFERVPWITPLRGGRTNMVALDIGMQRNSIAALRTLVRAAEEGSIAQRIVERPVLRVELSPGAGVHYGMFFGAGLIYRSIAMIHRVFPPGKARGTFAASIVAPLLIARATLRDTSGLLAPDKMEILLEGDHVESGEFYLVISSTLDRVLLRMRPFWGSQSGPARFTAIAASAKRLRSSALGIVRGHPRASVTPENGYTSWNVHRADIRLECGFTIDGELFAPEQGRTVGITAEKTVAFVRA